MNSIQFLSLLPAILGFAGFIVYILWTASRPPSPVLLEILGIIRDRKGELPKIDGRLTAKQVHNLLAQHPEFRGVLSAQEFQLLENIRKGEMRERMIVIAVIGLLVLGSIIAFVYQSLHETKTPIGAISLSGEVSIKAATTNEAEYIDRIQNKVEGWITNQDGGQAKALGENILLKSRLPQKIPTQANDFAAYVGPASSLTPEKLGLSESPDSNLIDSMIMRIRIFLKKPKDSMEGMLNSEADMELALMLNNQPNYKYISIGVNFHDRKITQRFAQAAPDDIKRNAVFVNWEDLIGATIYVNFQFPMRAEQCSLVLGSDVQPQFVILPDEFELLVLTNPATGYIERDFKTTLDSKMRKRSASGRITNAF